MFSLLSKRKYFKALAILYSASIQRNADSILISTRPRYRIQKTGYRGFRIQDSLHLASFIWPCNVNWHSKHRLDSFIYRLRTRGSRTGGRKNLTHIWIPKNRDDSRLVHIPCSIILSPHFSNISCPTINRYASRYFSLVLRMTSSGNSGTGGCLSQLISRR